MTKKTEAVVSGAGMFLSLITALVEKVKELGGSIEDIYRLVTPEGFRALSEVASAIVGAKGEENPFLLKRVYGDEEIIIDATEGTRLLSDADDVFAYIDPNFKNWGVDKVGGATKATPVRVYEMTKDATFSQMFSSLSDDVTKLCLTQSQIKSFVKKNRKRLQDDGKTLSFLVHSGGEIVVVDAACSSGGELYAFINRFGLIYRWSFNAHRRVVIPQSF